MSWTQERIDLLTSLRAGGQSFGYIASLPEFAGLSRGALVGKAHRLGLTSEATTTTLVRKRRVLNRGIFPPEEVLSPDAPEFRNIPLLELGRNECRYSTSTVNGLHLFCGAPTAPGLSWCRHHHTVVWREGSAFTPRHKEFIANREPYLGRVAA